MSYIESLEKTIDKYRNIDSESTYWKLATDSRIGELLHGFELAPALIRSPEFTRHSERCREFLENCASWSSNVVAAKSHYDPASNNLKNLLQFQSIVSIFQDLLSTKQFRKRQLFKHCMQLSFILDTAVFSSTTGKSASFRPPPSSRQSIKRAWQALQGFMDCFVVRANKIVPGDFWSRYFPKAYFISFNNAKDISFPVVFVEQSTEHAGETTGSIEECRLWLDIQLGEEGAAKNGTNLLSFNTALGNAQYEDRSIGETIEKMVLEALNYYKHDYLNKSQPLIARSIFFQIGLPGHQYDGGSIACAAFVATLTRLTGRSLPRDVFYSGQLGCDNNGVKGITEKAIAGWESGYRTFIVPRENLNELSNDLEERQKSFRISGL
ncbi:MAG: hypothetical protein HOC09_36845, partial [Deltaproteobacteria bacterium]|nr:hypothetical protein [Deltaproteobacteria bacterium]